MKPEFRHLTKNIKGILNLFWYTGIAITAITLILVIMFLGASYGSFEARIPTISLKSGSLSYRFNTKYLEVISPKDIVKQYKQLEMGKLLRTDSWEKHGYESLYNLKFPPPPQYPAGKKVSGDFPVFFSFDNDIPWNFSGIFELKNVPVFPIAFSLLVIFFLLFAMVILFNVKKLLTINTAENIFSINSSKYIKYISFYILMSEFIRLLLIYWINRSVIGKFYYSEFSGNFISTVNGSYFLSWTDVNYWVIFIGIITLLISGVLKKGATLKEDVDLTI